MWEFQLEGEGCWDFAGGLVIIHSSGQTTSILSYIKGITLDAGKMYEVAGRASSKGLDGIDEVGDMATVRPITGLDFKQGLLQG